jgi:hypothetical protein
VRLPAGCIILAEVFERCLELGNFPIHFRSSITADPQKKKKDYRQYKLVQTNSSPLGKVLERIVPTRLVEAWKTKSKLYGDRGRGGAYDHVLAYTPHIEGIEGKGCPSWLLDWITSFLSHRPVTTEA